MMLTPFDVYLSKLRYIPIECITRCSEENFILNKEWCDKYCKATSDDYNNIINCIKAAVNWVVVICSEAGIDPSIVRELDPYLSRLRYVKSGDILQPDDHNAIVDTLRALRDVLAKIESILLKKSMIIYGTDTIITIVGGTWAPGKMITPRPFTPVIEPSAPHSTVVAEVRELRYNTVLAEIEGG